MLTLILLLSGIVIAAFLNAVMDTLFDHFSTSIFKNLNPDFWNPNISWQKAKRIFGYPLDAWHLSKSMMLWILYIYPAIILHCKLSITNNSWVSVGIWWVIVGVVWCFIFDGFFDKILKSK